jgi:hypothetical protein
MLGFRDEISGYYAEAGVVVWVVVGYLSSLSGARLQRRMADELERIRTEVVV